MPPSAVSQHLQAVQGTHAPCQDGLLETATACNEHARCSSSKVANSTGRDAELLLFATCSIVGQHAYDSVTSDDCSTLSLLLCSKQVLALLGRMAIFAAMSAI